MNKKILLAISVIVLLVFCFVFFNYINGLTNKLDVNNDKVARLLLANNTFDDVIRIKFYTAGAIFLVICALPLTFVITIGKQIIKRESIN